MEKQIEMFFRELPPKDETVSKMKGGDAEEELKEARSNSDQKELIFPETVKEREKKYFQVNVVDGIGVHFIIAENGGDAVRKVKLEFYREEDVKLRAVEMNKFKYREILNKIKESNRQAND